MRCPFCHGPHIAHGVPCPECNTVSRIPSQKEQALARLRRLHDDDNDSRREAASERYRLERYLADGCLEDDYSEESFP